MKERELASTGAFVVVQELFLTETAQRADVVLPAACAYEKTGTVTSVCGETQPLKHAISTMSVKSDFDIFRLLARAMDLDMGSWTTESVAAEIRQAAGGPISVAPRGGLIRSACDTLFTSGTLGRYSKALSSVAEAPGGLYRWNS